MCMGCNNDEWCTRYFKNIINRCSCEEIKFILKHIHPQTYEEFAYFMSILNGDAAIAEKKAHVCRHKIAKTCKCCGKTFKTYSEEKECCSEKCRRVLIKNAEPLSVCPACGQQYRRKGPGQKYCSLACGVAARKAKKRQEAKRDKGIN